MTAFKIVQVLHVWLFGINWFLPLKFCILTPMAPANVLGTVVAILQCYFHFLG